MHNYSISTHSTPNLIPNRKGQYRQHCTDTDPERRKDKCVSIDADRRVWKCHRCDVGGSLDHQLHQLSETERQQRQNQQAKAEARQAAERQKAIARLRQQWDKFSETGSSDYLTRKGFGHIDGLRYGRDMYGQFAVMSLYGPAGDFRGFQRFYDDGSKRLAAGTDKKGAYFLIPGSKPDIVVCEGLTTGASVALATNYTVAIAVDCGNVGPTIASLKAVNSKQRIIIGADNDQWKPRNAGLIHAYDAARLHGVDVAVPDFAGLDTSGKPTDFDDVRQLAGLAEVARQIEQAAPPPEQPQEIKPGVLLKDIAEPENPEGLTPEAATAQLSAVISDFLDTPHRNGQPRKLLIRGAAGLGKTSQVRKALLERGISAEIYTPSHKLANEQLQTFQADNIHTPSASWQGRQQTNQHGKPLCQRADAVQSLESVGVYRVSRLLCGIKPDGRPHDPDNVCPYARQCLMTGYLSKVREYSHAAIKITQHALLAQPREQGQQPADIAVIDENPLSSLINHAAWDTTAILQHGGILSAAAAALIQHKECWFSEFRKTHPQALAEVKRWLADYAPDYPDIEPGMPDNMIQAKAQAFAERKRPRSVWRFAKLLAEALASDTECYNGLWFDGGKIRAAWMAHPDRLADMPVLILDGTAEADLLRRIWPELEAVEISVKRNARVVQVWDTACSHKKLDGNPHKLRERIQHFAESLPGRGAVIGPKSFIEQFNCNNAEVAHFGNLRGVDALKHAEWGVIVGRNQPPPHAAEAVARALAPHDFLALGGGYQ
ncbi:MAG: hypothetical protein KDK05_18885, partial [Candidatus Competibacteraceae bacterium]|nr:hypothetical protein [Candidatus Competibacteraceae bacterium]